MCAETIRNAEVHLLIDAKIISATGQNSIASSLYKIHLHFYEQKSFASPLHMLTFVSTELQNGKDTKKKKRKVQIPTESDNLSRVL